MDQIISELAFVCLAVWVSFFVFKHLGEEKKPLNRRKGNRRR
jgi:hypothetical protein